MTAAPMRAFSHPLVAKPLFLAELQKHAEADRLIQGAYWENGKGCAVGCSLESVRKLAQVQVISHSDHTLYERYLGIPRVLARVEDCIFEGLDNGHAKDWPMRFSAAVPVGADLTMVWPRFALWLLTDEVPQHTEAARGIKALADVATLYREWTEGVKPSIERWESADAAFAISSTATYAARAAYNNYDYYAASHAVRAAAYAAADRHQCYERMADKLIEIIKG